MMQKISFLIVTDMYLSNLQYLEVSDGWEKIQVFSWLYHDRDKLVCMQYYRNLKLHCGVFPLKEICFLHFYIFIHQNQRGRMACTFFSYR